MRIIHINPRYITPNNGTPTMNDIITIEQASESDMRALSQMFARAASAVVDASELGKTVKAMQAEVEKLVGDTSRLREHISWLEQENVTLRGQRDEAQNALSDARRELDGAIHDYHKADERAALHAAERDSARGEAKLWQEEAGSLEKERNGLKAKVAYLTGLLDSVWHSIEDHFRDSGEVKPVEATPIPQSTDPNAPHYVHQPRDEFGRWVEPKQSDANSGDSGQQQPFIGHSSHQNF